MYILDKIVMLLEFPKVLEQPLKKEGGKAKSGARNNACKSEAISFTELFHSGAIFRAFYGFLLFFP